MNVRLVCTLKRRVPKNGMPRPEHVAELDHLAGADQRAPRSTDSGLHVVAEPRSSPAPHFDGQRWPRRASFQV